MRLDNCGAIVTGAAKGIGAGIAERFVEAGASVLIFDVDGPGALSTAERLRRTGRATPFEGDASREDDVRSAVAHAVAEFGRLDVLINNVGADAEAMVPELASEAWDRVLAVNLKSAFLFAKHAIPHMRGRGGAIVNISSVHAFASYPRCAAYDASKAGMLALTRTLALDHGRDGIRVNAICPGYIDTPMMEQWLASVPDREAAMREVLGFHLLGRIGQPRDIAEAALFLASAASAFITGSFLVVDGGLTIGGR